MKAPNTLGSPPLNERQLRIRKLYLNLTELLCVALIDFIMTKILVDTIVSRSPPVYGWIVLPTITACLVTLCYFTFMLRNFSLSKSFCVGFFSAWLSSSIGIVVESAIYFDLRISTLLNFHNFVQMFTSVLSGPIVIMSPFVGGLVFVLGQRVHNAVWPTAA